MPPLLKSKSFLVVAALAGLIGLYALAGFVAAPKMIRSALIENVQKALGVTPSVGEIRLNPFLLQLEVKDFSLPDQGGEPLAGFGRLFVDVSAASIWRRALVFKDIEIGAPFVHAVVGKDGKVNLASLQPKNPEPKPPPGTPEKPLPRIDIQSFALSAGLATYEDLSRPSHFSTKVQPIDFELHDFTTGVEGGLFHFAGTTKLGERIEWQGHLAVQPVESDGEFKLSALQAHTISDYLGPQSAFKIGKGTIDVEARYRVALKDAVDLKLDVAKIDVADLAIGPQSGDETWIVLPKLAVGATTVDLAARDLHVDTVTINEPKLNVWLEADKSLNLMKLAGAPDPAAPAAGPAAATPAWHVSLRDFEVKDASISAEDRGMQPAVKVLIAPLSLGVEGASSDLSKPVQVKLNAGINGPGSVSLSGSVTPTPLAADVALKLANIDLQAVQPYIANNTGMTLKSGRASGDLKIAYGAAKPLVEVAGNLSIADLHTVDDVLKEDFINWQKLDLLGLKYRQEPAKLVIDRVVARKPYARFIIETDRSLNLTRVLRNKDSADSDAADSPEAEAGASQAAPAENTPVKPAPKTAARRAASKSAAAPAPKAPAAAAPAAMAIAIRKVEIATGELNFSDLSIKPHFSASIAKLNGSIAGLSSDPATRAVVDLHGEINPFAPVSITGKVNVLSPALYTDVAMSFRNIDLTIFNPYSGKWAGYAIAKGKLTTELQYKVEGRKLDAHHHVIIDQLEFGAKTPSKDAVSLPLKLAVALLKDRNGVIDLDIPVTGSLDDPHFRLAPLIFKVLGNLLVKIVTSPFALLGSLFHGGPDLQFVDFGPGDANLDKVGADKMQSVAKALHDRPQLKIEVPIAVAAELDRPALIEVKFAAEVRQQQALGPAARKAQAAAPDFAQLDPAAQAEVLAALYTRTAGGPPKYPDEIAAMKPKESAAPAKVQFLTSELKQRVDVSDEDLHALAQQRALAMQQALLAESQLDPERVFLVANDKAKVADGRVRLELALQ